MLLHYNVLVIFYNFNVLYIDEYRLIRTSEILDVFKLYLNIFCFFSLFFTNKNIQALEKFCSYLSKTNCCKRTINNQIFTFNKK